VRFTWPGFAPDDADRAPRLDELVELLRQVVLAVNGGQPVTLVLHDWGCVFGYHFARQHPQLVRRVVGVDIGDAGSAAHLAGLNWKAKAGIAVYQLWLALAWKLGGTLGDGMARKMAAAMKVPTPAAGIRARMGHPYWQTWTGGYRAARPFEPAVPMFFIYGRRKPFQFHSRAWAERLAAQPGSRVLEMKTGHWVMVDAPSDFQRALLDWLG
jgi:pimeloyl-ACP methyl ester carboxylesterase